jgi:hypothetical protein
VLETLDASGYAGDLTIDLSNATATIETVLTGSGDDTVTMDFSLFDEDNDDLTVNLGAGVNTLIITGIGSPTFAGVPPIGVGDYTLLAELDFSAGDISGISILEIAGEFDIGVDNASLDLDGIAPTEIVFAGRIGDTNVAREFEFLNTQANLTVTFEGPVGSGPAGGIAFDFGDTVNLVLNTEQNFGNVDPETNPNGGNSVAGENLGSVTVNAEGVFFSDINGFEDPDTGEFSSLSTLTLNDASELGTAEFVIDLNDTVDLNTINLNGMISLDADGDIDGGTVFDIFAADADFDGAVMINLGNFASFDYVANDDSVRETFKFVGTDIGDVSITDFEAGIGANRDQLDFSEFAGVNSTDDLIVTDNGGGNFTIEAADGQFTGTITLDLVTGLDASDLSASIQF